MAIGAIGVKSLSKAENKILNKIQKGEKVTLPEFSFIELNNSRQTFSNEDLKNNDYSLINVFASWCSSCAVEHHLLMKLSRKIKIYGIAWRDIDKNTKNYLEKYGNPYQKVGIDNKGKFQVKGTPESFLVNSKGEIIYYLQGPIDEVFVNQFLSK
ncbi:MAG: cytochrome c biogenesis protein CcmG/thiol:disulfide interchange protein DsbE [Lentimonas sp.]|jgi:cytochrome c biogenesis protein CcmG/thiol:disulfide interchange protein DsbE